MSNTSSLPDALGSCPTPHKKYVTRACDECKKRKCKCDGLQPCHRCSSVGVGDSSAHTFLKRVYTHLKSMGQLSPRNLSRPAEELFVESILRIPLLPLSHTVAEEYIECFYNHSNATYRYIPRKQIEDLLNGFYLQKESVLRDDAGMVVLFMVLAIGCIWLTSLHNLNLSEYKMEASYMYETAASKLEKSTTIFPPTIEVLQGHGLKCQFLLAVNMFNSAWLALGTAVRLGQIINFHLEQPTTPNSTQEFSRRVLLWSLYRMDRYLSIALGRPVAINDEDITIPYPESMGPEMSGQLGSQEAKTVLGVVAHIKLTQITSQILKHLYGPRNSDTVTKEKLVAGFEIQLQQWLQDTPSFFHPDSHSESFSYFHVDCRGSQQRTIRAAFYFTSMLLYRGFLLDEFLEANTNDQLRQSPGPIALKCVEAAVHIESFAGKIKDDSTYNAVFWTTSYFTFCALSILTVYLTLYPDVENRSSIETVLENAMEGHRKLDNSTNKQSQRLLEEAHIIAQRAHNLPKPDQPPLEEYTARQEMYNSMANISDIDHRPGQRGPSPLPAQEWIQTQQLVNVGEQSLPSTYGLTHQLVGDELGFIMNIGFDAPQFDFMDAFQHSTNTQDAM
ncbi:hypothetical protein DPV78_012903 [Talaromyces pinophilus]|nr:hypothetical protein DPV78_012903 [Talaromyces pinophilus]